MSEPSSKHPLKVFLCHASADKPKVRELYNYLYKKRIKPWFDEKDLIGGQDWQVEIPKALVTSDAIIICLTKNSVDKEGYIQREIKYALEKALEMPEGRIFLIPVRFEECDVPFSLSRYQWVDLFDEVGYARMMKALRFRASQLKRETIELPNTTAVVEKEKIVFEKKEQDAVEKAVREKIESEAAEKVVPEQAKNNKGETLSIEETREKVAESEVEKAKLPLPGKKLRIGIIFSLILIGLIAFATCSVLGAVFLKETLLKPTFTATKVPTFTIGFTPIPIAQNTLAHSATRVMPTNTLSSITTFEPSPFPTTSMSPTLAKTVVVHLAANTSPPASTFTSRPPTSVPPPTLTYTPTDIIILPTFTSPPTATFTAMATSSTQVSVVQSFPAPGSNAEGITWDGSSLWITDNSANIFKMDSSGTLLDSFHAPEGTPQGITWDGLSFWVFTTNRSRIYQVQFTGGQTQILGYFKAPTEVLGGGITQDLAWDGNSLWYANEYKVYHLDTIGNELSHFAFSKNVMGLDWNGSNLWLAYTDHLGDSTLVKVNTSGNILATYPVDIYEIDGLAWANGDLWALGIDTPGGDPMIYKIDIP